MMQNSKLKVRPYVAKQPIWRGISLAGFLETRLARARECSFTLLSKLPQGLPPGCALHLLRQKEVSKCRAPFQFSSIPREVPFSVSVRRGIFFEYWALFLHREKTIFSARRWAQLLSSTNESSPLPSSCLPATRSAPAHASRLSVPGA